MPLAAGQTLSHYEILGTLGAGGMGEVYRARDARLDREVAIKVLPEHFADDEERLRRFEREARTLASLSHANLAHVYGIDQVGSTCFIAMELVPGEDLEARLARGPLPVDDAVELCRQIAAGLEVAHAAGVVHRDLKPANVRIAPDGTAKVIDFGLAKSVAGDSSAGAAVSSAYPRTEEGRVLGTPPYMSPEQARGEAVDRSTDVWALGCVLYECLTGERPFRGRTSADVLAAILHEEPDWSALPARTPSAIRELLGGALAKDPADRLQELREAQRLLAEARRGSAGEGAGTRARWIAGTVGALALLVAVLWSVDRLAGVAHDSEGVGGGADAAVRRAPSIAVLPFQEMGTGADEDYFGDGLSAEISTALSRFRDLRVISRSQTRRYAGQPVDALQVARELGGIDYVLEGTVRRSGKSVKVDAWLTDAGDASQVWAQDYDAELDARDLFRTQEDLTLRVVNAIAAGHGELSRAVLASESRSAPESFDSYLCVLRAYQYWHAHGPENHLAARTCLQEAVARDPGYAEAWALLAYMYAEEFHHRWNEEPELYDALQKGLETARKAVRLDSSSQVAHGVLALIHSFEGDRERFLVEARTTIDLNPGNSDWLGGMGTSYAQLGFLEEGASLVRRALELNPTPMPWLFAAFFLDHYHHGRYDRALEEALRTETTDFRTPLFRAAAYGQLGRAPDGREDLDELRADSATDSIEEIRELLVRRNGYEQDLADHLLEGLEAAGFDRKR